MMVSMAGYDNDNDNTVASSIPVVVRVQGVLVKPKDSQAAVPPPPVDLRHSLSSRLFSEKGLGKQSSKDALGSVSMSTSTTTTTMTSYEVLQLEKKGTLVTRDDGQEQLKPIYVSLL